MSTVLLAMLAAIIVVGGVAAAADPTAERPITLSASELDGRVHVVVTGDAATPLSAGYTLHVASDPASGNRSTQSGTAHLTAGEKVVLIDLTVSVPASGSWEAILNVTPTHGVPYRVERRRSS